MDALGQTGCSYLQLVPNVQLGKNLHRTPGNCMLGLALMTEGLGLGAELTAGVPDYQIKNISDNIKKIQLIPIHTSTGFLKC